MIIDYVNAPCGAGKSYQQAQFMLQQAGRYLIVRDRIEAIDEYMTLIQSMMSGPTSIPMLKIATAPGLSVRREVERVPERFAAFDHVMVFITHKALLSCDFSAYHGWHIVIDETPVVLDHQTLATRRSVEFFSRHYDLTPTSKAGWSSVTLRREGWNTTAADMEGDELARPMRVFHERVTSASPAPETDNLPIAITRRVTPEDRRRAVLVNLSRWEDMADTGRTWTWWSVWSPKALEPFLSVKFMGNGFENSITFKTLRDIHPDIEWRKIDLKSSRNFALRTVEIQYFAREHIASAYLFGSERGADNLSQIARHLSGENQIWMTNEAYADALADMGGVRLSPIQAGSNKYASFDRAACMYSVKPSPETRDVLSLLGVDPSVWTASYEYETILQFVARTSLRDPLASSHLVFTVYDLAQAESLAQYMRAQSHLSVEVTPVDLGFMSWKKPAGGRPKSTISTPDEAEARKAEVRERRKLAARKRRAAVKIKTGNGEAGQ